VRDETGTPNTTFSNKAGTSVTLTASAEAQSIALAGAITYTWSTTNARVVSLSANGPTRTTNVQYASPGTASVTAVALGQIAATVVLTVTP